MSTVPQLSGAGRSIDVGLFQQQIGNRPATTAGSLPLRSSESEEQKLWIHVHVTSVTVTRDLTMTVGKFII